MPTDGDVRQADEGRKPHLLAAQEVHLRGRRSIQLPGPVILHHLKQERRLVRNQLGLEARLTLEGVIQEGALAKPVDGEDGRFVESVERL